MTGLFLVSGHGGRTRARTWDPLIKSQLLYQLSYAPPFVRGMAGSGAAIPSRISLVESASDGEIFALKDPLRKLRDQYLRHTAYEEVPPLRAFGASVGMTRVGVARRLHVAQRFRGNCASR